MKMHEDFFFCNEVATAADTQVIEIFTGPYKGVRFQFLNVKVQEQEGYAEISFDTNIVGTAKFTMTELNSNIGFQKCQGEILNSILLGTIDEGREDDLKEPVA